MRVSHGRGVLNIWAFLLFGIQWLGGLREVRAEEVSPWQRQYSGEEATRSDVIALWQFLPGQEPADNSGHNHNLQLRGQSRFASDGVFGNCLESFRAEGERNIGHGAVVKNHPSLSPPGPFTLELWIKPKPELEQCDLAFLFDKKYLHYPRDTPQANRDYCLYLRRTGPRKFRLIAYLGFGNDSAEFFSREIVLEPNRWVHVAFTYDGAGTGRFFLNGEPVGRTYHSGRGAIAPGQYDLVIGDRYGSLYAGFPGWIDQVRILGAIPDWASGSLEVELAPLARTAFLRMEKAAGVSIVLRNDTSRDLTHGEVLWSLGDQHGGQPIPQLAPHAEITLKIPVDTRWRPDRYSLRIAAKGQSEAKEYHAKREIPIVIVPRPLPNTMPVVMWGTGDLDRLLAIGFTHQLVSLADFDRIWSAQQPTLSVSPTQLPERAEMLNEYLAQGVGAIVALSPGSWVVRDPERQQRFQRVDRQGQPYKDANPCGLFPELSEFCFNVGNSVGQTFREFPALQAALIHTEVRDSTNLCFHDHDREAYRKKTGLEIPEAATTKWGVRYDRLPQFPENRVIADDDPLLVFYRWFWSEGDGWNAMHSAVHRGLKAARPDLWTFFDPAVRAPSLWGSGGEVDVISQWTYTYPDPIKIGQATDELFAMAEGRAGQQVMKMTQIIWYRSQTAPKLPEDENKRAPWEKEIPDAKFIAIAPDHLREAFWSKISRPVRGIMYHGWGSLVPGEPGGYRFTNPQTKEVLRELIRTIVRPLGPTLLQVPDEQADVAILESFTSQMFAGRGTYGWSRGWEADMHLVAQWSRLQPRIIYEETILKNGLAPYRVLILPACDVLPASIVKEILQFQKRGGIVVGDEFLTPSITPDIRVSSYRRTGQADKDKAALQEIAQALRRELQNRYQWRFDSSDPNLVVRLRRYGHAKYLFVLNDRRTFGDYVGHHGLVMEKGLPLEGEVVVKSEGRIVYDLVGHQQVEAVSQDGELRWRVKLGPGDGRVYLVLQHPLERVKLNAPQEVQLGEGAPITIRILDAVGQPVAVVVPVEVRILDPQGRLAEPSGFYGVKDGELTVSLDFAPNDLPGDWKVTVRELASGRETTGGLRVK